MTADKIPVLETARLWLIPPTLADAAAIQKYVNDPDILRYLSGFPQPYPPDGAEQFLKNIALPGMEKGSDWLWGLRLKSDPSRELIGSVHIRDKGLDTAGQRFCSRGFWLAKHLQQQGLMTEASEAATTFAFREIGFSYMKINNAVANTASSRIKQAAGFRFIRHDQVKYSGGIMPAEIWQITRDEWLARHPTHAPSTTPNTQQKPAPPPKP